LPSAAQSVQTIGVVVVEARVIGISADGSLEVDIDKTARCLSEFEDAAVASLKQLGYDAVVLTYDDEIRRLVAEAAPVHDRLAAARNANQPIEGVRPLEFAKQVATARSVDAIAFATVRFYIPSFGRHALSALIGRDLLFKLGFGRSGGSGARLALLDATGQPIYYNFLYEEKTNFSQTSGKTLERFCETLAAGLPRRAP
jgi:hypothetical protein